MNAGRELDALIAEKVMGWHNNEANPSQPGMWGINDYREDGTPVLMPDFPAYSEDIAAAWEVVEKIKRNGFKLQFDYDTWIAYWSHEDFLCGSEEALEPFGRADTAPHAICLAALKAVGVIY